MTKKNAVSEGDSITTQDCQVVARILLDFARKKDNTIKNNPVFYRKYQDIPKEEVDNAVNKFSIFLLDKIRQVETSTTIL